jgi:hypothetical protein
MEAAVHSESLILSTVGSLGESIFDADRATEDPSNAPARN